MKYYIKKRTNPQLGTYYIPYGKQSAAKAKAVEDRTLYGHNEMLPFATESEYNAKLDELRKAGERVQ